MMNIETKLCGFWLFIILCAICSDQNWKRFCHEKFVPSLKGEWITSKSGMLNRKIIKSRIFKLFPFQELFQNKWNASLSRRGSGND